MALRYGKALPLGPATVSVHDDRDGSGSFVAPCGVHRYEVWSTQGLDLEDLGFLALEELVDLLRVLVRELLDALLGAVLLVLADLALVDELLEVVDDVAPHVADSDAAVLGHPAHDLDELLTPLLGELRDGQADDLAVVRRRQAQVGLLDRALDRLQRVGVEGLNGEQSRLGRVDRGELLERRLLAVIVDLDAVEQRGRRAAGSQGRELRLRRLHRLVHPPGRVLDQVIDRHRASGGRDDRSDTLAFYHLTDVSGFEGE